jgi:hypothetical protein
MPAEERRAASVRGTIRGLNFAPKGEVEGFLLDVDGGTVQVNLPPGRAALAARLVGREVVVEVGPEPAAAKHPAGDHPVHQFVKFRDTPEVEGLALDSAEGDEVVEVCGTVARLNYAKHGEPNGVVLDTGDFVHLKPEGMRLAGLRVGQEVRARGKGTPPRVKATAIEAGEVNGVAIGRKDGR